MLKVYYMMSMTAACILLMAVVKAVPKKVLSRRGDGGCWNISKKGWSSDREVRFDMMTTKLIGVWLPWIMASALRDRGNRACQEYSRQLAGPHCLPGLGLHFRRRPHAPSKA